MCYVNYVQQNFSENLLSLQTSGQKSIFWKQQLEINAQL